MAVVHFVRMVPAADGSLVAAGGFLRFTPSARRVIDGTPDVVVLPVGFQVPLVDGAADVTLAPTTGAWVWRVDESIHGVTGKTSYVAVPNVAELDDTDLVTVDPATLEPAAVPEPAWVAMAASTVTTGSVAGDDLILTRTDGTTINAGNVRGAAGVAGPAGADSIVPGPVGPAGQTGATGEAGPTGATGPAGTAATVEVGTTATGAEGTSASVTQSGTPSARVLNFIIPRGATGATGPQGMPGLDGTSALPEFLSRFFAAARYTKIIRVATTAGTSIQDAINAAKTAITTSSGDSHPNSRALVILPAGTYNQRFATANFVDVIGADMDPATVIVSAPDGSEDTVEHNGTGCFLAGMTLRNTYAKTGATAAAIHNGTASTYVGFANEFIYYRLIAESTYDDAFSWGANSKQSIYAYDCAFNSGAGSGIYLHNFPAASIAANPGPALAVFDNCTATPAAGNAGVRVLEEYSTQPDRFIWKGGAVGGTGISFNFLTGVTQSSWNIWIDPTITASAAAGITINSAKIPAVPMPLTDNSLMQSYHYPDKRGQAMTIPIGPQVGATLQAVTVNRVFFIPFQVDAAISTSAWYAAVGVAAGTMAAGIYLSENGLPGTALKISNPATLSTNTAWETLTNRILYPGQNYYLGVLVTNATATVSASTLTPSLVKVRYRDNATLPNPAGATTALTTGAVPAVTLITA